MQQEVVKAQVVGAGAGWLTGAGGEEMSYVLCIVRGPWAFTGSLNQWLGVEVNAVPLWPLPPPRPPPPPPPRWVIYALRVCSVGSDTRS